MSDTLTNRITHMQRVGRVGACHGSARSCAPLRQYTRAEDLKTTPQSQESSLTVLSDTPLVVLASWLLPVVMKAPPAGRADRPQRNERRTCTRVLCRPDLLHLLSVSLPHTGPRYSQDSGHIRRVHRFDTSRAACRNAFLRYKSAHGVHGAKPDLQNY